MSSSHALLKLFRQIHLYLGVFIAPALLFFAFTGALQTFSLHETTRGSSYKPPSWAMTLAQIHKKQTPVLQPHKAPPPSDKSADKPADKSAGTGKDDKDKPHSADARPADAPAPAPKPHNALPLKIFFLLVSIGLFISTLTGLYMSYKYSRNRTVITTLLIAGTVIPIVLTIF